MNLSSKMLTDFHANDKEHGRLMLTFSAYVTAYVSSAGNAKTTKSPH